MAEIKSESVADFIPESVADFLRNQHVRYAVGNAIPLVSGGIQSVLSQVAADRFQNKQSSPSEIAYRFVFGAFSNAATEKASLVRKLSGVVLADLAANTASGHNTSPGAITSDILTTAGTYGFLSSGSTIALSPALSDLRSSGFGLVLSIGASGASASYSNYRSLTSPTAAAKFKEAGLTR
jgi:hypothetical protein